MRISRSGAAGSAGRAGGGIAIRKRTDHRRQPGVAVARFVRQHGAPAAPTGRYRFRHNEKDRRANADLSHVPIGCELLRRLALYRKPNGPSPNRLFA
jgi:hypothetical protein